MTYFSGDGIHEFILQISLTSTTGDSFTHDMRIFADQILNIALLPDDSGQHTIPIEIPMKSSAIKGFAVSGTRGLRDLEFKDASDNVLVDFGDLVADDSNGDEDVSLAFNGFGIFENEDGPINGIKKKFSQIFDLSTSAFTSASTADVKKIVFTPQLNSNNDPEEYRFAILYDNVD